MITENIRSHQMQNELYLLAERVEANRADLVQRCTQVLRAHLFNNRIELRPGDVNRLARQEADAVINALRTSFASARRHGVELCQAGLSIQTMFGIIQAEQDFFINTLKDDPEALALASAYPINMVEGFTNERENVIHKEQEDIRTAFEIALKHVNAQIQQEQARSKKASEVSYQKIILAQEEERRRISRELHDEAGQSLVGLRMSLLNLNNHLPDNSELKEDMKKALFWTDSAMQSIRTLAYRLRPAVLDLLGLNLAIKQLCIDFSEQTGLIISYAGIETPSLGEGLAISIYRIVQEALTNIIKHTTAKHAWVRLSSTQTMIKLSVRDDGQGFDPETIHKGIGLESMRERSNLLNGRMHIKSSPGNPALLEFSFPIQTEISLSS